MGRVLKQCIQDSYKKGDVDNNDAIRRGRPTSLPTRSVSRCEGCWTAAEGINLVFHWHTPDGQEHTKRYDYSVVRITDGVTTIAVAALQLKKFAQKAPEPLTACLDHKGLTFTYPNGTMHLQALGEFEEMPVVDLRVIND